MVRHFSRMILVAAAAFTGIAHADGKLVVDGAWIRTAPPGAAMRAGYATLRNVGDAPLVVRGARSDAFGSVTIHATQIDDGVARMRELPEIQLAPGEQVVLEPGGKHLMLMRPAQELATGAKAVVVFEIGDGLSTAAADFVVRDAADDGAHAHH
jgi:copper(I)-binding protein